MTVTENRVEGQGNGDNGSEGVGSQPPSDVEATLSEQGSEGMAQKQGNGSVTWVSLTEANKAIGVSKSALRKWYRTGRIKSQTVDGKHGPEKRVVLEEVRELAAQRKTIPPPEPTPGAGTTEPPREEETQATLALVEALVELSGKYAEAEGRAAAAEQKVEHLEARLREVRTDIEGQRSPITTPEPSPTPPESRGLRLWRSITKRRTG